MAEQTVPHQDAEETGSRTTLRLDDDTHFRLKWTAVVLKKSMQDCISEAVVEWLDKNVGAVQDVIKKSSHRIVPSMGAGKA